MIRITFENPMYLWYLLGIPLLIYTHFYLLRHSKAKAMKFANFDALKRVTGEKLITKNTSVLVMRVLVLACIIVAASGVVLWYQTQVNENDFIIAIDVSASMAAQDVAPTRLEAAKQTAIDFIDQLSSRSTIGIVTFSGTTFIDSIPIDNKNTLKKTIEVIEVAKTGGTDIAGAIITSTNMLLPSKKGKTIIIFTDGSNTVGAFIENSIQNGLDYAIRNHVVIHAIGIGSEAGPIGYLPEYYNISAVYNENILKDVTNQTGGYYYQATDTSGLKQAYHDISLAAQKAYVPLPLSYSLMLIALVLLFLEWGFISTRFRKMP
jgi:Ca-activated chloride channel family protein